MLAHYPAYYRSQDESTGWKLLYHTDSAKGPQGSIEISQVTGRYENDRAEIENVWLWDGAKYQKGLGEI